MFTLYTALVRLLAPLIRLHVRLRARIGKEDKARLDERYGITTMPNFTTRPVWIHAASVGEAQTALTLVPLIRAAQPLQPILITTGTVTGARIIGARLPALCVHQYAPLDHPDWVTRFLTHWRPRLALRLESELWPTTLDLLHQQHIPTLLLNGHMSDRSFSRWRRFAPGMAKRMLAPLDLILCEGQKSAAHFTNLGAPDAKPMPNIKLMADPLPLAPDDLRVLQDAIIDRPVWVYASTHAGEEELAARIHRMLRDILPGLLTIIIPRHPERRAHIRAVLNQSDLRVDFRSVTPMPEPRTDLYVADTMGEMGIFYAACPVAVIGRSFSLDGGGGHNPIEAALMACYPLSGPHVQNLQSIYDYLTEHNAAEVINDPDDLRARLCDLLEHSVDTRQRGIHARQTVMAAQDQIRRDMATIISPYLKS